MARYDFASDNVAGAMPEVMEALGRFNGGFAAGYGDDEVCARAADLIRALLDVDAEVRFAASGTAANALCLAALAAPHEAVLAHEHSHVATDETGAPGFFGAGLGIIGLPGASGRIDPAKLKAALGQPDHPHWQSPAALSVTNATEFGALYDEANLSALIGPAKAAGLKIHLDGARLANAVAAGFDPKAVGRLGVAALVLGGTKAGSTPTEAIVLIDKTLEPPLRRPPQARRPAGLQGALPRRALDRHAGERRLDRPRRPRQRHGDAARRRHAVRDHPPGGGQRRVRRHGRADAGPPARRRLVRLPLHRRLGALHVLLGDDGRSR